MTLDAIVRECESLRHYIVGIADHVNHPDHVARNAALRRDVDRLRTNVGVYFGAEDNYLPELGGHSISPQLKARFGYQYVIGTHHNLYLPPQCTELKTIVRTQHEHHLETCRHPAMDVLGHPFRYLKGTLEKCGRPPTAMEEAMPDERVRELGRTARDTGTAIEINAASFLANRAPDDPLLLGYLRLIGILAAEGVEFALGSDAHHPYELALVAPAWDLIKRMGISPHRIWRPEGTPASAGLA
jgi:histidinol phosphatase-like PHP family hydrolase